MSGHGLDNHSSIPYWATNLFLLTTVSKEALEPTPPLSIFLNWIFLHGEELLMHLATHVHNNNVMNLTATPPASSWQNTA